MTEELKAQRARYEDAISRAFKAGFVRGQEASEKDPNLNEWFDRWFTIFGEGILSTLTRSQEAGEVSLSAPLERALDFIGRLTDDPLLMGDDIEMTLEDVQKHARIELESIRRMR